MFLNPYWSVFVFAKPKRSTSRLNEICSTLAHTKFSACAIRFYYRTRKVWTAMCSIFLLRFFSERYFYDWKESAFFPSVNFIPRSCFSDFIILLMNSFYDDNFDYIWGDVASLFLPESWYRCDSDKHSPSYVYGLNLTSTSWLSHFTCSCLPLYNFSSWRCSKT